MKILIWKKRQKNGFKRFSLLDVYKGFPIQTNWKGGSQIKNSSAATTFDYIKNSDG